MRGLTYFIVLIWVAILFAAATNRPVHIFMAGDSTMANKPLYKTVVDSITGDSIQEPFPERGWGQLLPTFFNETVVISNHAMNGRSTRTFIEEGRWTKLIEQVMPGDYVVIQFGHNDSSVEKKDRYTSPEDYRKNVERFVDEVFAKGGIPVLCTSVVRRNFDKAGNLKDSHGEYPDIVRAVAKEKQVYLVDMYNSSKQLIQAEGSEKSTKLFLHVAPGVNRNFPEGKIDNTHFNENGARLMAGLFVSGIKELKINPLVKELKSN